MSTSGENSSYHHGNLKQTLLQEGLKMLEEHADGKFSLRELARRVGVSANSSYRHFRNKDDLMLALAIEGHLLFAKGQMDAFTKTEGSVKARFLATGLAYCRFARQNPALFRLMFGPVSKANEDEQLCQVREANLTALKASLAVVLGLEPHSEELAAAADGAWATVHGLSHLILAGVISGSEEEIEQRVEMALRQWLRFI